MGKFLSTAGLLLSVVAGCGGGAFQVQQTPQPDASSRLDDVSPPSKQMSVPGGQRDWIPATIGSGHGDALAQALRDRRTLVLILPNVWRGAEMEDRIFQMVKLVSPDTQVVARGSAAFDGLWDQQGEIPYSQGATHHGTEGQGGPVFIPKEHPLYREWISDQETSGGAEALLVVRPIRLDAAQQRQMREKRQGGCDALLGELEGAIASQEGLFVTYEQLASRLLYEAFKRHLEVALPFWKAELEGRRSAGPSDSMETRCIEGYLGWLDQYAPCIEAPCEGAPRLSATGGGTVGMTDGKVVLLDACPTPGMRDYPAELAQLASRSVREVLPSLDNGWITELIRYDGLKRLTAEIDAGCAPRHRRIVMEELAKTQDAVQSDLIRLAEGAFQGVWEVASGRARFPGVGPVSVLARVRVTAGDPAVDAADLKERMRRMERCSQATDRPIQVILVDRQSAEVVFMGIFYEEALLCRGLPPG